MRAAPWVVVMIAWIAWTACDRARPVTTSFQGVGSGSTSAACPTLTPKAPARGTPEPLALPSSSVSISLPISLPTIQPKLDALIPTLSDPAFPSTHEVADGVCATWYFDRRPLQLHMEQGKLRVAIPGGFGMIADPYVELADLGCTQPFVSCGDKSAGAAPLPIQVNVSAGLALGKDYRLAVSLRNSGTSLARCTLAMGINATPIVLHMIDAQIDRSLRALGKTIGDSTDVRAQVARVWTAIQVPRQVASELWLVVRPTELDGLITSPDPDTVVVQAIAKGTLEWVAQASAPTISPTPLPDLTPVTAPPPPGLHVAVQGTIAYDVLEKALRTQLVGKREELEGPDAVTHQIVVHDVHVTGPVACANPRGGRSCVSVAVEVTGDVCGQIYLTGRPTVDSAASEIVIQDLDFSVDTSDAVVSAAAWLGHDRIVRSLGGGARVSLAAAVGDARTRLTRALNQRGGGWQLAGTASEVALGVAVGDGGLSYTVDLSGSLAITVAPGP